MHADDLTGTAVDSDLVIEAAPEDEALKLEVFRRLDRVVKPEGILASHTSSIPLVKMAAVTSVT